MQRSKDLFLQLVRPQWRRLHAMAQRYVEGPENRADLVQETLLRAWRGFSPAEGRTYTLAWLLAIMRNVALEWHRTARRRVRLVPAPNDDLTELVPMDCAEPLPPLPAMNEQHFLEFLDDQLASALEALDPAFREVLLLSVAGGLTYREIAEVIDCPVGTVMSRMARARRTLRERLSEFARSRGWKAENSLETPR